MASALEDALGRTADVRTTVWTGALDFEHFETPTAIRDDLSRFGSHRMRTVHITAEVASVSARVRITRELDRDEPPLRKGVLLEVCSLEAADFPAVRAVHERLTHAVARGEVRGFERGISAVGHRPIDSQVSGLARHPPSESTIEGSWIAPVFVLVVVLFFLGPAAIEWGGWWFPAVCGTASGLLLVRSLLAGGIMLGASNRIIRLRARSTAIVGSATGAGVGAAVKFLSDG